MDIPCAKRLITWNDPEAHLLYVNLGTLQGAQTQCGAFEKSRQEDKPYFICIIRRDAKRPQQYHFITRHEPWLDSILYHNA